MNSVRIIGAYTVSADYGCGPKLVGLNETQITIILLKKSRIGRYVLYIYI